MADIADSFAVGAEAPPSSISSYSVGISTAWVSGCGSSVLAKVKKSYYGAAVDVGLELACCSCQTKSDR